MSRAASNTPEALERNSIHTGLEAVELGDWLHCITAARSCAVNMDTWVEIMDGLELEEK